MFAQLADIGKRLKEFRIENRLSPEQIADSLGVSRAAVYRIENGVIAKVETLNRLAGLFGVSLPSLLGAGVECFSDPVAYFERIRQVEKECDQLVACFSPFSFFLTRDDYALQLKDILMDVVPPYKAIADAERELDVILHAVEERRRQVSARRISIISFVNMPELERWLKMGTVGRSELSPENVRQRRRLAREQVEYLLGVVSSEPMGMQVALLDDTLPDMGFQLLRMAGRTLVNITPYRAMGETINLQVGVSMITADADVVAHYERVVENLWIHSCKGSQAVERLRLVLDMAGV